MRRHVGMIALSVLLILAIAAPALAAKPVRGCPNEKFDLMGYTQFRNLSLSVGVPEDLLGAEHAALWDAYDRNNDGMLCIMDLPDTPGHFGTWVFNVIDNTANR